METSLSGSTSRAKGPLIQPVKKIAILDGAWKTQFYRFLRDQPDIECFDIASTDLDAESADCQLLLVNDEYGSLATSQFSVLNARGIGVLHLIDGIIEWKNQWENPRNASETEGMPLYRPILANCIACLGPEQERLLRFWGEGFAIGTGSPRFDQLGAARKTTRPPSDPTILVVSANTPGFTQGQFDDAYRAFMCVRQEIRLRDYKAVWRVVPDLAHKLGVKADENPVDFASAVRAADVVISQPSTCVVEAMIAGKPVAQLDFSQNPRMLRTVWNISSEAEVGSVIQGLLTPSTACLEYQDYLRSDQVCADGRAGTRILAIAEEMIAAFLNAKRCGKGFEMPSMGTEIAKETTTYQLSEHFPDHMVFGLSELEKIRAELGHLRLANHELRASIRKMRLSPLRSLLRSMKRLANR